MICVSLLHERVKYRVSLPWGTNEGKVRDGWDGWGKEGEEGKTEKSRSKDTRLVKLPRQDKLS